MVLPGLDGTGALLTKFSDAAPDGLNVQVVSYPTEAGG